MNNPGTITRRISKVVDDLQNDFKALYSKDDFESKLKELKVAEGKSNWPSTANSLYRMFEACEIEFEKERPHNYYKNLIDNAAFPDASDIEEKMLLALFNRYKEYPTPEEYMRRIVDRLCFEEDDWKKDTLRLRILKQFIKYGDYLKDAGFNGKGAINRYVKDKAGKASSVEDILRGLDDEVFALLDNATKDQKKPNGTYGLLKVADDLATGKFRAEGATKKSLYFFAMVYNMTYHLGDSDNSGGIDTTKDIEINLFRDYYANNLMRFITDVYKGKVSDFERDPSEQGINYKNFAEMIYLYFISKDIKPADKIKLSSEMIKRIQDGQLNKEKSTIIEADRTVYFRKEVFSEDILNLSEEAFEKYIFENYDCNTVIGEGTKVGVLQLETEQNSAFQVYQSILDELKENGLNPENCNYGLWFADVSALENIFKVIRDKHSDIDSNKLDEFKELLIAVNSFLGRTFDESVSKQNLAQEKKDISVLKTKALFIPSAKEITRTALIVAYYYYYNVWNEDSRGWSFEDVFEDFKSEIDEKLEAAHYQPFSERNIFDVVVAFSAYAYLNS